MEVKPFSKEKLNFFKFASIVFDEFPKMLRSTFVSLWDMKIAPLPGYQVWDDSPSVRTLLLTLEGGTTPIPTNISIEDWDCTALFQATIYSKTFAISTTTTIKTLHGQFIKGKKPNPFHASLTSPTGNQDETITLAIDQVRLLRNNLCHLPESSITKSDFDDYVRLAKDAIRAIGFSTDQVDYIGSLTEGHFPTERVNEFNQKISFVVAENQKFLKGALKTLTDGHESIEQKLDDIKRDIIIIKNQTSGTECTTDEQGTRGLACVTRMDDLSGETTSIGGSSGKTMDDPSVRAMDNLSDNIMGLSLGETKDESCATMEDATKGDSSAEAMDDDHDGTKTKDDVDSPGWSMDDATTKAMNEVSVEPLCVSTEKWEKERYKEDVHVDKYGVSETDRFLKDKTENMKPVEVNIGVAGDAGVGKSTFIRRLSSKLSVEDADRQIVYNLTFLRLPSRCQGTPNYRELEKFDIFLILTSRRFTEDDCLLAKIAKSMMKLVFFIRTHIDMDYANERRKRTFNEEEMLRHIRDTCLRDVQALVTRPEDVFLISNHEPAKWDFDRLKQALLDTLTRQEGENLTFSLATHPKEVARQKDEILRAKNREKWEQANKEDARKHIEKYGISGIENYFRDKLESEERKDIEVNIAVTGNCCAGKSTFINKFRGLKKGDKGAAKTGVTETTREKTVYYHPNNNKIKFSDLPGLGTQNNPDFKTYCKDFELENCDTFLIFCKDCFTQNNRLLAEKVKELGKPFFFIRTHIDVDYENEVKGDDEEYDDVDGKKEKAMLEKITKYCLVNLKDLGASQKNVFLISNRHQDKWDFGRLTQAILDAIPQLQRESLTLSLTSLSKDLIKRKVKILAGKIWMVAAASGVGALVQVPEFSFTLDIALLTNEVWKYKSQLGVPDETAPEFKLVKRRRTQEIVRMLFSSSAEEISKLMKVYCAGSTVEEFAPYIPFVGSAIAASISFGCTYKFLHGCLNELENAALNYLDTMKLEKQKRHSKGDRTRDD